MAARKLLLKALGLVCVVLGVIGAFLPLLPTTPFLLLAAWCFARAHPEWEQRLLSHPRYGPSLRAWRARGAVPLSAKRAATLLLLISAAGGWFTLPGPWHFLPMAIGLAVGIWLWTRPSA